MSFELGACSCSQLSPGLLCLQAAADAVQNVSTQNVTSSLAILCCYKLCSTQQLHASLCRAFPAECVHSQCQSGVGSITCIRVPILAEPSHLKQTQKVQAQVDALTEPAPEFALDSGSADHSSSRSDNSRNSSSSRQQSHRELTSSPRIKAVPSELVSVSPEGFT